MLYYTILHYTTLYYTILYYTILYYTILYYTILYYTILYFTILYYTILYYTILYCIDLACRPSDHLLLFNTITTFCRVFEWNMFFASSRLNELRMPYVVRLVTVPGWVAQFTSRALWAGKATPDHPALRRESIECLCGMGVRGIGLP